MSFVAASASKNGVNTCDEFEAPECCDKRCCECSIETPVAVAPRPQRVAFGMAFEDAEDDFLLYNDYASECAESDSEEEDLCSSFELQASIRASLTSWR
jgi:hypothetical protein